MVRREILDDIFIRASVVVCVGIALFIVGRFSLNLPLSDWGLLFMIIGLLGGELVLFTCLFCKVEQ